MSPNKHLAVLLITCAALFAGGDLFPQGVEDLDRLAQEYYEKKQFDKAINTWMRILEDNPENERVQKKIELVYEEKHRKDLAYERSRRNFREARSALKQNEKYDESDYDKALVYFKLGKYKYDTSYRNFVVAYRIDPGSEKIQQMKKDLMQLDKEVRMLEEKIRFDQEKRRKYREFMACAKKNMKEEKYPEAIVCWDGILGLIPLDKVAREGKRKAELAISDRLKFEKIRELMKSGEELFATAKYSDARLKFQQVLYIDPENGDAKDRIEKIDEILEERFALEKKRQKAEELYVSGIRNLSIKNFDQAEDDFNNVLDLIKNYKDTKQRLESIPRLRKLYLDQMSRERIRIIEREIERGWVAYIGERYRDAIASFEKVLELDPKNDRVKELLKQVIEARRAIEEDVIDENSPYFNIVNTLIVSGKILYEKGDCAGAVKKWNSVLKLFPKNITARGYLLKCVKSSPEDFKKSVDNILQDGKKHLENRRHKHALMIFELVKNVDPDYPGIERLIASAKKKPTERVIDKSVSPKEIEKRYYLGLNLYRRGGKSNLLSAMEQFRWIVKRDPNNTKAIINLNKIESILRVSREGDTPAKGKRVLSDEQKRLVRLHYFRGINYYSNNQFSKAIDEWRKVLAIDRNHEMARNNIKKCLVLIGR